ncbi:MAG: hypothetical protein ACREWG_12575 [Gammaproteobacteria bacterium]
MQNKPLFVYEPMTRTMRNRVLYVLSLAAVVGIIALIGYFVVLHYPASQWYAFAAGVALLLIPGRLQQIYWKEYFRGQRLQLKGQHAEAMQQFEGFLARLEKHPGLRHLIWFSQWFYTQNVEVMALNNMGVSALWLEDEEKAEALLNKAAKLDPDSPLPYYNLAVMHYALGDEASGAKYLTKAKALGYKESSLRSLAKLARDGDKSGKGKTKKDKALPPASKA